jgi:dual specificity tyrosine-phosphorylation-regulated kinase 2/3/4
MPPEILNYILYQNKLEYDHDMLSQMDRYKSPWIIDIWSLGCIILEIISGVPLWMSIDTRIEGRGNRVTGLFAAKNRVFAKIIQKQIEVVSNLEYHLNNHVIEGLRRIIRASRHARTLELLLRRCCT